MSKPKISQNIEQGLSLSPQQLIRANILQLNSIMLEARLYQELESNPALEIIENEPVQDSVDIENDQEDSSIDYNDDDYDNWNTSSKTNDDYDATLNLKNQSTLFDQVMSVLRDENLNDDEIKIAEQVVGNLDNQGYLEIDSQLIADRLNTSNEIVLSIIEKIKHSEFPGLASSNIRECLLSQLSTYNISELATNVIKNYFDDFMNRRYEKIIKKNRMLTQ